MTDVVVYSHGAISSETNAIAVRVTPTTTGGVQVVRLVAVDASGNASVLDDAVTQALRIIQAKGAKITTTPSVTTTAAQILAANMARKLAVIVNPSTTATLYIGAAGVSPTVFLAALPPNSNASYFDGDSTDAWYGCWSAGTGTAAVSEIA